MEEFPSHMCCVSGIKSDEGFQQLRIKSAFIYCLVVWNIFYFPFHIWDVILPIDFHIFQDGYCPTNQYNYFESTISWMIEFASGSTFLSERQSFIKFPSQVKPLEHDALVNPVASCKSTSKEAKSNEWKNIMYASGVWGFSVVKHRPLLQGLVKFSHKQGIQRCVFARTYNSVSQKIFSRKRLAVRLNS